MRKQFVVIGFGCFVFATGVLVAIVRPKPGHESMSGYTNTPGLAPEADGCHEEQCLCFERGADRVCVTDAELGRMVRRTTAFCPEPHQLNEAIGVMLEERRLKH